MARIFHEGLEIRFVYLSTPPMPRPTPTPIIQLLGIIRLLSFWFVTLCHMPLSSPFILFTWCQDLFRSRFAIKTHHSLPVAVLAHYHYNTYFSTSKYCFWFRYLLAEINTHWHHWQNIFYAVYSGVIIRMNQIVCSNWRFLSDAIQVAQIWPIRIFLVARCFAPWILVDRGVCCRFFLYIPVQQIRTASVDTLAMKVILLVVFLSNVVTALRVDGQQFPVNCSEECRRSDETLRTRIFAIRTTTYV